MTPLPGMEFGAARTTRDKATPEMKQAKSRTITRDLLRAYVLIDYLGETMPCPNLDRAKVYAHKWGTESCPVIVRQRGRTIYRYPER